MFNFRDIAELFLTHQAAILVHDKEELRFVLEELLIDFNRAEEMGRRAKELVLKNTGSTEKNLRLIEKLLSSLRLNLTTP
jgi:3-deoxy-D-manno-octulosonic-acid transferase